MRLLRLREIARVSWVAAFFAGGGFGAWLLVLCLQGRVLWRGLPTSNNSWKDEATDFVRSEVGFALQPYARELGKEDARCFLASTSAMNYVQSSLSSARYGNLRQTGVRLPREVGECFRQRSGVCGHHAWAFLAIVRRLGLTARSVEFYWDSDNGQPLSHVAAEVHYGGEWHFFDVTWGTYFTAVPTESEVQPQPGVLSLSEIMTSPSRGVQRVTNCANLMYQLQGVARNDPFEYLTKSHSVIRGKHGVVRYRPESSQGRSIYRPTGLPDYIGAASDYGAGKGSISLRVPNVRAGARVTVHVRESSCVRGFLRVSYGPSSSRRPIDRQTVGAINFTVGGETRSGEVELDVVQGNRSSQGYVAIDRIVVEPPRVAVRDD